VALCSQRAEILATEREEASLCREVMRQGLPCSHRPDISVQAVLGIELRVLPAQARGSSPQHAHDVIGLGH
jgi:hypothetical protein